MKKSLVLTIILTAALVIVAACTKSTNVSTGKPIATVAVNNNLTATLSNATGQLKKGDQEVTLAFTDSSGKPVEVGWVGIEHHRPAAMLGIQSSDAPALAAGLRSGEVVEAVNGSPVETWEEFAAAYAAVPRGEVQLALRRSEPIAPGALPPVDPAYRRMAVFRDRLRKPGGENRSLAPRDFHRHR